jgi:predicted TIM-barrel fold metal-dependent hydrolase
MVCAMTSEALVGTDLAPDAVVIDCDVHVPAPETEVLGPYLSAHWREYVELTRFSGVAPLEMSYPRGAPTTGEATVIRATDSADRALDAIQAHLDAWNARMALINCVYPLGTVVNPDLCGAIAGAINDWLIDAWLERESRLRASLVVPPDEPDLAAREIGRVGSHPGFVQVLLPVRSSALYGNRRFHPLFEAAARHQLVVGLHFGGYAMGAPPTASGYPTYYLEEYVGMASVFQSQLRNVIFEGVFDRFPETKLGLVEGGFSWLPALMWRMDSDWRELRRETPWLRRPPSEYVHEHVRLALQPVDSPQDEIDARRFFEQMDVEHYLMFSTDHPHSHFDSPREALPAGLDPAALHSILAGNASDFYRGMR